MTKYKYTIENQTIEVNDISEVPEGISYEEIAVDEAESDAEMRKQKLAAIKEKYEFHRRNGWDAYQDFRAMIVQNIADEILTEAQAFIIEKDLKIGYDRISQNGDWKTAQFELSLVTVSYPFVQPYMDIAMTFIQNYIAQNYDS